MHPESAPVPLLVTCLCAAWCGSCREYRATFDAVAQAVPEARFLWVDIEDEADLVDPIEVENFPSVLIAAQGEPVFFGPLTPHRDTLLRLVRTQVSAPAAPLPSPDLRALVTRLAGRM